MIILQYSTIILLSIIEGLTEFLPISSTGHMIIFNNILNITENEKIKIFEIIIQLGSITSACIIFWSKIIKIINNTLTYGIFYKKKLTLLHIIVCILPIIIIGLLFYNKIKSFMNIITVIYGLMFGSIMLYLSEIFKPKTPSINNINCLTYNQILIIGFFQCLSLFPGISRSGSTLSISLLLGISRLASLEFCFIIAIPIIFGASFLEMYKHFRIFSIEDIKFIIIGFIISFIISLMTIKFFLYIISNFSLKWFAIYRLFIVLFLYIKFI
ncbi:undecaprenyl-diphosphate phosphatase [Enterobacteriaceae endosymbiont of Plateumaris braccata]|uniref:undecaprenyl-diphosphate phosphatase n=1 Tax=Enterobacteriaceae endosymbiont of Plateumaris braccata TaxID=2675793 RepID=UPI00144960F8|nr:undecaprenyl-diphosphate phosphatase [Enterobacteriaceae endosymbiont of Plateumaris braccata]QJC28198.1 undecaprenyl-diphosphate phosphatase [Enterobacteriaceae endosymbiont of Plateumaris braccata]